MRIDRWVMLFLVTAPACTASNEFYSPDVHRSDRITIGSCGGRDALFRRELKPGIVIEAAPGLTIIRVAKNNTFQLKQAQILIKNSKQELIQNIQITGISTGVFPFQQESNSYGIPVSHFKPLDRIIGTRRYESIDMHWGEWSRWKGKADIFQIETDQSVSATEPTVFVELPEIYVNDSLVVTEPIKFTKISKRYLQCFQ